jgi:hypothetical protein
MRGLCLSPSIECALDVLASWHVAGLERCSCIILLSCKNHELLLMSSPSWLLKSTWILSSSLELSIHSIASLLLLPYCYGRFSSAQLPLLSASSDVNINFMISSITSSSFSHGWLSFYILLHCTSSLQMGISSRSPRLSSSNLSCGFASFAPSPFSLGLPIIHTNQ